MRGVVANAYPSSARTGFPSTLFHLAFLEEILTFLFFVSSFSFFSFLLLLLLFFFWLFYSEGGGHGRWWNNHLEDLLPFRILSSNQVAPRGSDSQLR